MIYFNNFKSNRLLNDFFSTKIKPILNWQLYWFFWLPTFFSDKNKYLLPTNIHLLLKVLFISSLRSIHYFFTKTMHLIFFLGDNYFSYNLICSSPPTSTRSLATTFVSFSYLSLKNAILHVMTVVQTETRPKLFHFSLIPPYHVARNI